MSKLFKVISVLALIISIFGLFYPVQKSNTPNIDDLFIKGHPYESKN